jgi:DNA-binding HxlR family transcriptional regulator
MNKVHYTTPILKEHLVEFEEDEMSKCRVTKLMEHTIKDKTLKIPIRPYIHPAGLRELARLNTEVKSGVSDIAMYLISLMNKNTRGNTIEVAQSSLANAIGISSRTVVTGLAKLEEHAFISKVGKSSYKVSAKLAWYGSQMSWAKAIKQLKYANSLGEEYYAEEEGLSELEVTVEREVGKLPMPYVSPFKGN